MSFREASRLSVLCLCLLVPLNWWRLNRRIDALERQLEQLQAQVSTVECSPVFNAPEPPLADPDPQPTPVEAL